MILQYIVGVVGSVFLPVQCIVLVGVVGSVFLQAAS